MSEKAPKRIVLLPGDGIGPEVIGQAVKVLQAIGERFEHEWDFAEGLIGHAALQKTGSALPEETLELCQKADAILFGASGSPEFRFQVDGTPRPEDGILQLRKAMGLYANLRPVKLFEELHYLSPLKEELLEGVDFLVIRELTGGIYFGERGWREGQATAYDTCVYSLVEVERIARFAFEYARERRRHLTLVDKANVLETSRLWRKTVLEMQADYPDVEVDYLYADHMAMELLLKPSAFDVILTSNLVGDILSEEAAVITGSLGLMPSASMGGATALFEPVHGTWPKAAGKDIANPIAAIASVALMLEYFKLPNESEAVWQALSEVLRKGIGTPDIRPRIPSSCSQVGDMVAHMVMDEEAVSLRPEAIQDRVSTII